LKEAKFYGGEPLLISIYFKIWDRMLKLNPDIKIFTITNGSVMNQKVKDILERGNFDVAVSMDSTNKEKLESIRKNVSKEQLLENIEYFNDYCRKRKKNLVISFTMMRINWQDFPEMIRFCNEQNAILYVSYLKTPPRFALWNLPANELRQIREKLIGKTLPKGNYVETSNAQCFDDLITFLHNAEKDALERDPSEIIPYSITENNPYSYLPVSRNSTEELVSNGIIDKNESLQKGYDSSIDYRELLSQKLRSELANSQAFFKKTDGVMSNLPEDADRNKIHYSMFNSEVKELVESVYSLSEEEVLLRMQEAI